ncbi:DoxX family protein [Chloroherpeton thalassium ATCC 35110]|uniref:DoxX family protein n=1 Tax=Chloroherpeton thalassium (strain ATCC 35110 / GB-78) TaxID=517418 RepID=B3QRQ1_CHLT3|nr:hypothetical protein [Chloroherpeton thalassium]ACF13854.1 DoxX family protein [Chloroherpeton thalassium ATCC 35110]
MTVDSPSNGFKWEKNYILQHPFKTLGVVFILMLRFLFGAYFMLGFTYKVSKQWLWTNKLQIVFQHQLETLTQLNDFYIHQLHGNQALSSVEPDSPLYALEPLYLKYFAIPFYLPIAWVVSIGELIIGLGLLSGLSVRLNAAFALFILVNFAAGGYFQFHTSIPLMSFALLFMCLPSGHWFGLDRKLYEKYPNTFWFK